MLKTFLRNILTCGNRQQSEPWFECLSLSLEQDMLRVAFPHAYFADWFSRHKRTVFEEAVRTHYADHEVPQICYEGTSAHAETKGAGCFAFSGSIVGPVVPPAVEEEFSLADFICNAKNAFPLAVAGQIAAAEAGSVHSPFLLCGVSGTGKTHLLKAMAAVFIRRYGREHVVYTRAAHFFSGRADSAEHYTALRPHCRALFLDDLQDIGTDTAAQVRCAAYLDTQPADRQSALGYGGSPRSLKNLDERLRSRLESGLVLELNEPDLDVRLRYLQEASKQRGLSLGRHQLLFLAQRCMRFPLLYGMLRKVEAFAAMHNRALTPADMENIVRSGGVDKNPGCREILAAVAVHFNLRPEDILGGKRRPDLVLARQTAMYVCRKNLGLSYPELGRAFGGRDHSTVIHAVKKIHKLLLSDKALHRLVTELEHKTL